MRGRAQPGAVDGSGQGSKLTVKYEDKLVEPDLAGFPQTLQNPSLLYSRGGDPYHVVVVCARFLSWAFSGLPDCTPWPPCGSGVPTASCGTTRSM